MSTPSKFLQIVTLINGSGGNVNVTTSASSAQSAAITANRVRLAATADCYIAFGANPTADNTCMILLAGQAEIFQFTPGQKVAALQVTAAGVLSIMPV